MPQVRGDSAAIGCTELTRSRPSCRVSCRATRFAIRHLRLRLRCPRARCRRGRRPRARRTKPMDPTKRHLSRRTVLRGAGVALALPLLDAMIPAATALAQTAAKPKLRMGFFYIPHGAIMGNTSHGPAMDRWTPRGAGADFKLSPILASLEPYKKYVTSFGNLEEQGDDRRGAQSGAGHLAERRQARAGGAWCQHGDDAGPDRGASDWPGHDPAIARSRRRDNAAERRVQRFGVLLQHHAVVSRCALAAADGVQPAQGLHAAVR